jgi:hypothetical protein
MFVCTPFFAYKVIREILFSLLILAAVIMNRDHGDDLGSDEERSIELKDLAKDDIFDILCNICMF